MNANRWLIGFLAALFTLSGCGADADTRGAQSPEEAARSWCIQMADGEYEKAADLFSTSYLKKLAEERDKVAADFDARKTSQSDARTANELRSMTPEQFFVARYKQKTRKVLGVPNPRQCTYTRIARDGTGRVFGVEVTNPGEAKPWDTLEVVLQDGRWFVADY